MGSVNFDQHMLIDEHIRDMLIESSDPHPEDVVIEVGPGTGFITKELVKRYTTVIAIESDPRFKDSLSTLPPSVEVQYGNALEFPIPLGGATIVANLPFSISEPFLKKLIQEDAKTVALLVSRHFYNVLKSKSKWAIITPLFFTITKICDVPKEAFFPQPKVMCVLLQLTRRNGPFSLQESIIRELVLQDDKKLKNALINAIKSSTGCTKWQARQQVLSLSIPERLHDKRADHLSSRQFQDVVRKVMGTRRNRKSGVGTFK